MNRVKMLINSIRIMKEDHVIRYLIAGLMTVFTITTIVKNRMKRVAIIEDHLIKFVTIKDHMMKTMLVKIDFHMHLVVIKTMPEKVLVKVKKEVDHVIKSIKSISGKNTKATKTP